MTFSSQTSFEKSYRKDPLQPSKHSQVNTCIFQGMPSSLTESDSQLPTHIESYHSLVPLDTNLQKSSAIFGGYSSWVYKAQSSANGNFVALRRLEGKPHIFVDLKI